MFYAAFMLGLLGSLHCVVMCGPITLALSGGTMRLGRYLLGKAFYNGGRMLTYTALGAGLGLSKELFGVMVFDIHGAQEALSLAIGSVMLVGSASSMIARFAASKQSAASKPNVHSFAGVWLKASGRVVMFFRRQMGMWLRSTSYGGQMILGVMNGFLPCGFVYMALALAALAGSTLEAAASMAVFGLGTVPAMLGMAVLGRGMQHTQSSGLSRFVMWISSLSSLLRRAAPVVVGVIALLFILRGLALDIPYLSPKLHPQAAGVEQGCHTPMYHPAKQTQSK